MTARARVVESASRLGCSHRRWARWSIRWRPVGTGSSGTAPPTMVTGSGRRSSSRDKRFRATCWAVFAVPAAAWLVGLPPSASNVFVPTDKGCEWSRYLAGSDHVKWHDSRTFVRPRPSRLCTVGAIHAERPNKSTRHAKQIDRNPPLTVTSDTAGPGGRPAGFLWDGSICGAGHGRRFRSSGGIASVGQRAARGRQRSTRTPSRVLVPRSHDEHVRGGPQDDCSSDPAVAAAVRVTGDGSAGGDAGALQQIGSFATDPEGSVGLCWPCVSVLPVTGGGGHHVRPRDRPRPCAPPMMSRSGSMNCSSIWARDHAGRPSPTGRPVLVPDLRGSNPTGRSSARRCRAPARRRSSCSPCASARPVSAP